MTAYRDFLGILVLLLGIGCSAEKSPETPALPRSFIAGSTDTLRFGEAVPNWQPGTRVVGYDLRLPDGATQVFVEVDAQGRARLFEFLYPPARGFEAVVGYYEGLLGPSTRHAERPAGQCAVWEEQDGRFEVCRAREPDENGSRPVIAHVLPPDA